MCLGGAGPAGPVIRAVLPAAGSLWWPRALAFRFHILGDSLSAQILNSQFGTIKKKKKRQRIPPLQPFTPWWVKESFYLHSLLKRCFLTRALGTIKSTSTSLLFLNG